MLFSNTSDFTLIALLEEGRLWMVEFISINSEQATMLEERFCQNKVFRVIYICDKGKAPEPNRFNFNFFKIKWVFIKVEVIGVLEDFFMNRNLEKGLSIIYCTYPKDF